MKDISIEKAEKILYFFIGISGFIIVFLIYFLYKSYFGNEILKFNSYSGYLSDSEKQFIEKQVEEIDLNFDPNNSKDLLNFVKEILSL